MTVLTWRILCYVSAGLFVAVTAVMFALHLLKNRYYRDFHEDELIKRERTDNSRNALYFTHGETRKYIKKYVLCQTVYDKFLVCNFAAKIDTITYFVLQYNRRKRPVAALRIEENVSGEESKVIALDRRCAYVNVVAGTVDGVTINTDVIRPLAVAKIRLHAFLKSMALFLGLFVLRHVLIEVIAGKSYLRQYLADLWNYIAVGGAFVFSVLHYFIAVKCFRSKNGKRLSGGNLVYDFL
ncbi:MAG: hypothetical protein K2L51_01250 [Clostridiales bacterium]|nr:hypothetical protein [Clostridiales bacterium]